MFQEFDDNLHSYTKEERVSKLEDIWSTIVTDGKKNKRMFNESDFTPYFCNIIDYYDAISYTSRCGSSMESVISSNYKQ
jgi:hypothetical protein